MPFTIQHVDGTYLADGSIVIGRLSGFCHADASRRSHALEDVSVVRDPDSTAAIVDLGPWLVDRVNCLMSGQVSARERHEDPPRGKLTNTIEMAMSHAEEYGFEEIAERLRRIRNLLPGQAHPD